MHLLFDLDGTLTDPFAGITNCILYALERLGRPLPDREKLRWCIGPPLKYSFAKLLASDDCALVEQAVCFYRERFATKGLYENEAYEQIPEVLERLGENDHFLYVATSKPAVYARRIVTHFGFDRYFRAVYGSELDGTRSDKADLIAYILQSESVSPSDAVMIGDRKHDAMGARANGVRCIGALWGYGTQTELEAHGADTCVRQPVDLAAALSRMMR